MAHRRSPNVNRDGSPPLSPKPDPRLDFFSEKFDPLLALRTPGLTVPVIGARTYDNIAKYKSAYDDDHNPKKQSVPIKKQQVGTSADSGRKWLPHQMPVATKKKESNTKNLLARMDAAQGPLSALRKCKDDRLKIKVWIRHSHGIRGYLTGFLVAFDKHWNLALEEVEEFWTRLKKRKTPSFDTCEKSRKFKQTASPPEITVTQADKKTESCTRRIPGLLVRGEQIATIILPHHE